MSLILQAPRDLPPERIPISQIQTAHLSVIEEALGQEPPNLPIVVCRDVPSGGVFLICGRARLEASRSSGRNEISGRVLDGDGDTAQRAATTLRGVSAQVVPYARLRWPDWSRESMFEAFFGREMKS